jgi:hypothetical protein
MPRLIELPDAQQSPAIETIAVGDLLWCHASGARVRAGQKVVELLGAYRQAIVGDAGAVVTPMGPPNCVLLRARAPGRARVDLLVGDPFGAPQTVAIEIHVDRTPSRHGEPTPQN